MRAAGDVADVLRAEVNQPVPPEIATAAAAIAEAGGTSVAAILFYGSCLRGLTADGIPDFYVLVDDYRRYHRGLLPSVANRLLPPTVWLWEGPDGIRVKVAVVSRRQFSRRMRVESLDVTLWSRFCQPVALVYARDPEVVEWTVEVLARAVATAAQWAVRLGPSEGTFETYWVDLFRHTYRTELRPETQDRAGSIYASAPERYDRLLRAELARAGIEAAPGPAAHLRLRSARRPASWWWPRRWSGKLLTVARLAKAAFTFVNGADYLVWKIERHTGERIRLAPWHRDHPLLAAPLVLWRLWRRGLIR